MNLHPSGCPVTPSLLRRFLADVENAPCPGDLSACLGHIEQLARQEEPLCLDLSGSWDFCMSAADDAVFSGETVQLPGTMDENGKGTDNRQCLSTRHLNRDFVYTGPDAYRRSFHLPAHWSGRPVMLELERTKKSRVLLGGVPAGPRQTSYTTPHRYDLSALCRPGESHTLTIEVDNSAAGMPHAMYSTLLEGEAWSHQITEHTQTNWNGIIGRLQLTAPPVYAVSSLTVRPDVPARRARLCAVLARPAACEEEQLALVKIQARCLTADHRTEPQWLAVRFAAGQATVSLSAFHGMGAQPLLWDEFHPNRYRLTLHLYTVRGSQLRETEACADFGMRRFTAAPHDGGRQFFINGRPTLLRGEINCAVFLQTGCCPTDPDAWLRLFRIYKDYGLNHVRFHTWVPPRAAFQAADQLGLYLYVELPQWGRRMFGDVYQGDCSDADYYKNEVRRIFSEYGNSPSFVMFALGNEERIGFYYYEEFLQYCRALEPELLYSDIAGHSTYPPSADFAAKFLDPAYLPLVTPGNDWDYTPAVSSAPIAITGHEVGQLQVYPDYDTELPRYETAVLKPRNLEYFQGVLAQAGLAGRSADFSAATGKLAAMLYQYFTESYLRTPGAGGFTLLGLQDFPGQGTALVGLLDAFAESKGGHCAAGVPPFLLRAARSGPDGPLCVEPGRALLRRDSGAQLFRGRRLHGRALGTGAGGRRHRGAGLFLSGFAHAGHGDPVRPCRSPAAGWGKPLRAVFAAAPFRRLCRARCAAGQRLPALGFTGAGPRGPGRAVPDPLLRRCRLPGASGGQNHADSLGGNTGRPAPKPRGLLPPGFLEPHVPHRPAQRLFAGRMD